MYKEKVIDVKEYDNLKVTFETLNDALKVKYPLLYNRTNVI